MKITRALAIVTLNLSFCGESRGAVQEAFLVQNSGWMEPFYTDPQSQLKALVSAVIGAAAQPGEHIFVSAFSQSTPQNPSPRLMYEGEAGTAAGAAVASIRPAQKAAGGKYADTDFQEAVRSVIQSQFKARTGIVWIVTNNKNSPNNSPDTAARNREFYGLLHDEPSIFRTLAFPLKMNVQGRHFAANGLMIYALAYGREASDALQSLVRGERFRSVITEPPARLKPLDTDVASLTLNGVHDSGGVTAGMAGRTIVVDVDYAAVKPYVDLTTSIENTSFPYEIVSADIAATAHAAAWQSQLDLKPAMIANLQPGAPGTLTVRLPLPSGNIPSVWSFSALASLGKTYSIPGMIQLQLTNQRLQLASEFRQRLAGIFPGDPLPESFVPPEHSQDSRSAIPFVVRIAYPIYPLALLLLLLLLGVAGLVFSLSLINSRRRYEVRIDNESPKAVYLKAFQSLQVRNAADELAATLSRSLGSSVSVESAGGHQITVSKQGK